VILGLNAVDWIVIVLALVVAYTGWLHGFVVGVLSFVGFVGGAALGLLLVPKLLGWLEPGLGTSILAVLLVLAVASIGQGILAWAGGWVRSKVSIAPARKLDAAAGALIGAAGFLVAAWAIGLAISTAAIPSISSGVRESSLMRAIDDVVPVSPDEVRDAFQEVVVAGGFPEVVVPWTAEPIRGVDSPDGAIQREPGVRQAADSVVQIIGRAECDRILEGSGFVIAEERVMTNAHVVAGVPSPVVQFPDADPMRAQVVMFDPAADIAVLAVPGLELTPLEFAGTTPAIGADGVVIGYPNNGPLNTEAIRVRGSHQLIGHDIYGDEQVARQVVSLRGDIQPGNSGGPLVDLEGGVYGVVFASSLTDPDTGYALAREEVEAMYRQAESATQSVSTGACT
jgi:S1-C subfamily serine protease